MNVLMLMVLVFINASPTMADRIQEMLDLGIKCGECPCVNPCSQKPPLPPPTPPPQSPPPPPPEQYCNPPPPPPPPPPMQYCSPPPPPPSFIYTAGMSPPPPARFIYVMGAPKNLHPTDDPYNLQIYSNAPALDSPWNLGHFLLVGWSIYINWWCFAEKK